MTLTLATQLDQLDLAQARAVKELNERAKNSDGVSALAEQGLLGLTRGTGQWWHLLLTQRELVIGYAGCDPLTRSAELVVDPDHRRHGHGTTLAVQLRNLATDPGEREREWVGGREILPGGPRLWAHGDLAAAQAFAGRLGLVKVRELWLLRRDVPSHANKPAVPAGFDVCEFRPGIDEAEWLTANAVTFADHPEQGAWLPRDLADREAEDWFDPSAFLLLRAEGRLAGFVWLKIEGATGEIYVLGVVPEFRSKGLGKLLTSLAMWQFATRGLANACLYVEADNTKAVAIYRGAGFDAVIQDGQYSYPG